MFDSAMIGEIVKQAPWAVVIIIVMIRFLRFTSEQTKVLADIGSNCHLHTERLNERSAQALNDSAEIIRMNSLAIGANTEILRGFEKRLNGK